MSNSKTGGSAFPRSGYGPIGNGQVDGMSLRDYLAAKFMQESLAPVSSSQGVQWAGKDQLPRLAEFAYWAADAMLEERTK